MRVIACEEIIERMRINSDNSRDSLLNSQVVAGIKTNRWKKNEMGQLVKSNPLARQREAPQNTLVLAVFWRDLFIKDLEGQYTY